MNSSPKYTLSIGMIVKNEEKYMRRCLDSMKPLLDNISCELVIVDTGSTDKTVEIAREYTDKIYFFDWINNFAAARNFSLQKCTGEWFLYNDADTIFDEDMSEMIEFFNNKELNSKYQSGTYITRNYHDPSHTTYAEHKEHRFARITPELKFVGIIHEVFNCTNANMYHLNTFAHHYGYSFANLAEAQAKSKRNTDLLKIELKNNPNDLRILSLLFDSAIDNEEKAGYLTKALGLAKTSSHVFAPVAYVNAVEYY